ncbi:MFS transporter [Actinotalea sp. Marseille-Q4924]|uniref:MFS transporter n=1 Tax=Actinotalea sp. Marseille-Q4924 TaxID=2866571 RepID=UPI001CE423DD|nr:MFS transporter [Actinotalea sp. Marseille-Q4924]
MVGVPPRQTSSWFARVVLSALLLTVAVQAIRPMVSYRALALGGGALDLGVVAASFGVLALVLAVPMGRRVDRWGGPPVLLAGAGIVLLSATTLVWIDSLVLLAVNQAALGLAQIMFVVSNQAMVGAGASARRDARYGYYTATVSLGQMIGPSVAGLLAGAGGSESSVRPEDVDTDLVFATMAGVAAVAVLVAITLLLHRPPGDARRRAAGHRTTARAATGQILRIPSMPQAMLVSLTVMTSIDLLATYLPLYGTQTGLSVQVVGFLLAARAGASVASRLLMTRLIRFLGRKRLLIASLLAPATALATFPFVPLPGKVVAMVVAGLGLGLGQPVTLSWVAAAAPGPLLGTALGLRITGNRVGVTVIPVLVGAVASAAGVTAVFGAIAVMLGGSTALLAGARFDDRGAPDGDDA